MEMEFMFGQMGQSMLENFHSTKSMEKVYMNGMMEENFRVRGIEGFDKVKVFTHLRMAKNEKEFGSLT